jgi:threonine aldolase
MAEDHANAKVLGEGLQKLGLELSHPVETNCVFVKPDPNVDFQALADRVKADGYRMDPLYGTVRFVTHLQTPRAAVDGLLRSLGKHLPAIMRR